jgi:hypothetical protein
MSLSHGANVVRNGLILCLDAANPKSYPGSGTAWTDLSSNGNNGTLVNGPTYSSVNGGYIEFDGGDEYINGSLAIPSVGSNYTLESMVFLANVSGLKSIFSHGRSGVAFSSGIIISGNNLRFRNSSNDHAFSSPTTLTANQWYHFIISITPSGSTGYCNSVSQGTTVQTITSNTIADYHIGRRSSNSASEFMNGRIAFIRAYQNKALSALEVQQNFEALRGRYGI